MARSLMYLYGNCQMVHLAWALNRSPELAERFDLHALPSFKTFDAAADAAVDKRVAEFERRAKDCAVFIYQAESWDRNSDVIMSVLPASCVRIPMFSIALSSAWPHYFKDIPIRAAKSPAGPEMFPYGDTLIAKAVKAGEDPQSILARYLALDVDEAVPLAAWRESNLEMLRRKEQNSSIAVSGLIEERFTRERLFFTPNHPTNLVFRHVADQLLGQLGCAPLTKAAGEDYEAQTGLGGGVHHPVHPSIVRGLDMAWLDPNAPYKHYDEQLTFAEWVLRYAETARAVYGPEAATA